MKRIAGYVWWCVWHAIYGKSLGWHRVVHTDLLRNNMVVAYSALHPQSMTSRWFWRLNVDGVEMLGR